MILPAEMAPPLPPEEELDELELELPPEELDELELLELEPVPAPLELELPELELEAPLLLEELLELLELLELPPEAALLFEPPPQAARLDNSRNAKASRTGRCRTHAVTFIASSPKFQRKHLCCK